MCQTLHEIYSVCSISQLPQLGEVSITTSTLQMKERGFREDTELA